MARHARFQLKQEDKERLNAGMPIRLSTFGGYNPTVRVRSLQHVNPDAWQDHLFEMTVEGKKIVFSASELLQALQSV